MPFQSHIRMTALGRLGLSGERFSYGLNLATPVPGDMAAVFSQFLEPNDTALVDTAEDVRAFHARSTSRIAALAVLEEVKFASIGADGKYTDDPFIVNVTDTPGGFSSQPLMSVITPQSALAVSLGTEQRGPRGKGRFYIPMPVVDLDTALQMPTSTRDEVEGSAATLLNAINNQPGIDAADMRVVVASSSGNNYRVTSVRVGRVVDTIRSRRRSIPEDYGTPTAVS